MKCFKASQRGLTLVETVVVVAILAVVLLLAIQLVVDIKRSFTQWTTGVYSRAPTVVLMVPASGNFVLSVTRGTGVDANGQPVGMGAVLPGDTWNFQLIGSGGDPGVIQSLNGTVVNALTGTATTDQAGIITIVVQVDADGPYVLAATRPGSPGQERTLFVGQ